VVIDGGELAGQADAFADAGGVAYGVVPGDADGAAIVAQQRREDADQCGLACDAGPEQAVDGAGRDGQSEPVQRVGVVAEPFGDLR
jgi:hypothetical protein